MTLFSEFKMPKSYNYAALKGCGSYNKAALKGFGKFRKGSPEAKAYMAKLRAMRKNKCSGGKCKGGSGWDYYNDPTIKHPYGGVRKGVYAGAITGASGFGTKFEHHIAKYLAKKQK